MVLCTWAESSSALFSHSPENDPITKLCCRSTSKCYYTHCFDCMYINVLYSEYTRNSAHFDTKHVVSECLKRLLLVQQIIYTPRFSHVASLKMKFAQSWKHTNSWCKSLKWIFPIWYNVVMVNKAYFTRYTHLLLRDTVWRLVADLDLMSVTSVNVIAIMTLCQYNCVLLYISTRFSLCLRFRKPLSISWL